MSTASDYTTIDHDLFNYTKKVDKENKKILMLDREYIWQRLLVFYKTTSHEDLFRLLSISFEGYEDAIDAGGIRIEFFSDLIRTIDNLLFEGKPGNCIPIHSWDKIYLLQMAGLMIGHSILQEGPGMPTLAKYVYKFIVSGDKEKSVALITSEDLPNTPKNSDLTEFIKMVGCWVRMYLCFVDNSVKGVSSLPYSLFIRRCKSMAISLIS